MGEIPEELIRAVKELASEAGEGHDWTPGTLEVNQFSVCFRMLPVNPKHTGLYVKIPKHDFCLQDPPRLFPLTTADRRMGLEEFESLCCLEKYWGKDSDGVTPFVKAVGYEIDYNAVVTRAVVGQDAYPMFVRWVSRAARGNAETEERFVDTLRSIAQPLGAFHGHFAEKAAVECEEVLEKIRTISTELEARGVDDRFLKETMDRLDGKVHVEAFATRAQTLKGLDIRNVLWSSTGAILIDPGARKSDWAEADLARFLVTLKLLFWGSFRFLGGITPPLSFETAFLNAYEEVHGSFHPRLLTLLTIKELFKHWRMAYVAVTIKGWPPYLERMASRLYVDRFYKSQVRAHLSALAQ